MNFEFAVLFSSKFCILVKVKELEKSSACGISRGKILLVSLSLRERDRVELIHNDRKFQGLHRPFWSVLMFDTILLCCLLFMYE